MQESTPESHDQSSESESSTFKRKRGRPKGSKNKVLPSAYEFPVGCPSCESTEYRVISTDRQLQTMVKIGTTTYNWVTWRRCRCMNCEQIYMRRVYRII